MLKKLIFIPLCIFSLSVFANPIEIKGAFGYEFGQKIDVTKMESFDVQPGFGLMIPVSPPKPASEYFKEYSIIASIKSFQIVMITASKKYSSYKQCLSKKSRLLNIFEKTYGPENVKNKASRFIVKGNNGKIDIRCKNSILLSMYMDENLGNKAIAEWNTLNDKK